MIARALVVATFIKAEPPNNAASGVPIMIAYNPCTGLTPARMLDAIASGMLAVPVTEPVTRSETRFFRFGEPG